MDTGRNKNVTNVFEAPQEVWDSSHIHYKDYVKGNVLAVSRRR
jgi:hypothetical protein